MDEACLAKDAGHERDTGRCWPDATRLSCVANRKRGPRGKLLPLRGTHAQQFAQTDGDLLPHPVYRWAKV